MRPVYALCEHRNRSASVRSGTRVPNSPAADEPRWHETVVRRLRERRSCGLVIGSVYGLTTILVRGLPLRTTSSLQSGRQQEPLSRLQGPLSVRQSCSISWDPAISSTFLCQLKFIYSLLRSRLDEARDKFVAWLRPTQDLAHLPASSRAPRICARMSSTLSAGHPGRRFHLSNPEHH
jgi:hypothetical protein